MLLLFLLIIISNIGVYVKYIFSTSKKQSDAYIFCFLIFCSVTHNFSQKYDVLSKFLFETFYRHTHVPGTLWRL